MLPLFSSSSVFCPLNLSVVLRKSSLSDLVSGYLDK